MVRLIQKASTVESHLEKKANISSLQTEREIYDMEKWG